MAARAPGQDAAREEPSCFNCGIKGHFAIACPEEVRKEPAGLQAFRERKAAAQSKGSRGGPGQGKGSGGTGMIITKYAPPPHPSLPQPPPAAAILGYYPQPTPPPHAAHPAQSAGPPAWHYPPSNYSPAYQAPPPPPPPTPAHHAQPPYEPYAHPAYPPAAPNGGSYYPPPYSAPPPPPQPPYYPGPQSTYNSPIYPPPAQSAPVPGFPYPPATPPISASPSYPYTAPPPPTYTPHPYDAAQGYYPPSYLDERGRGNFCPGARGHGQSRPRGGSNNRDRDRHRDRDRDRERHRGRDRDRNFGSKNQRKGVLQKAQTLPQTSGKASPPSEPQKDKLEGSPITPAKATGKPKTPERGQSPGIEDILGCDLESAFTELPTKPADPVGQPLPSEYTDAPTIPPAFDAKCLKSEFFSADDCDSFSSSIRDTKYWKNAKHDPVFKAWAGMVSRRFVNSIHLYHSYRTSSAPSPDEIIAEDVVLDEIVVQPSPPRVSSPTVSNPRLPGAKSDVLGKHARGPADGGEKQSSLKRFKGIAGLPKLSAFQSPPGVKRHHQRGEGGSHLSQDSRDDRNTHRDSPRSRESPYNSRARHDSGYQSNNSPDKPYGERFYGSSNATRDHRGQSRSRPQSRSRSRSRSSSRQRGREAYKQQSLSKSPSGRHGRHGSPSYARTRSSSPLDDFEREILGIAREEAPEKKAAKPKRRHDRLVEVFRYVCLAVSLSLNQF
ncbi:hypothetical protein MCOR27_008999 [Pyricularia oryzae]|uniref:CCHC-type domain-containing protein n=1 Tax=Pyricularia grisea TaxID=148305 RepID=A0ABQ8N7U1_PYRGI|nr:hypothetical protein MCOR01_008332 [Pyricularia oryzae]KAI6292674.1 hypothetical protein MCOR33_009699 [Pyricularia grisea]KAH9438942.1 hypothetical protein MCOR02_002531 [Pyricularia oryzae]KAI6254553.1 hypothetical protein MCOR19_008958 [Pyricularia oryzae]KAI6271092.1 hypothetical protein MCOR27_008999 [Pyricularia oryzae]